ncbi:multicopper oxidase domain-containing protein, partial [Rothia kristinae]
MPLRSRAYCASTPGEESSGGGDSSAAGRGAGTQPPLDLQAVQGKDHRTRSAVLYPAAVDGLEPNGTGGVIHRMTLTVTEQTLEVAPGAALRAWTYNGDFIGPTLRGRGGDNFEVTRRNRAPIGHSGDIHAGD